MRGSISAIAVMLCACGFSARTAPSGGDVAATDAGAPDGTSQLPDALACEKQLLIGGTDPLANGWSVIMEPPAELTNGPDYVALHTSTTSGQTQGGQLLLRYPGAVDPTMAFRIEIVMLVEQAAAHHPFEASVAILPSFTSPAGTMDERGQMLYLETGEVGWGDQTDEFATPVSDGAYHSYVLAIDADGTEQVSVDGQPALMRVHVLRDGAITIGDQSNDQDLDSTLRIRSITRLCM